MLNTFLWTQNILFTFIRHWTLVCVKNGYLDAGKKIVRNRDVWQSLVLTLDGCATKNYRNIVKFSAHRNNISRENVSKTFSSFASEIATPCMRATCHERVEIFYAARLNTRYTYTLWGVWYRVWSLDVSVGPDGSVGGYIPRSVRAYSTVFITYTYDSRVLGWLSRPLGRSQFAYSKCLQTKFIWFAVFRYDRFSFFKSQTLLGTIYLNVECGKNVVTSMYYKTINWRVNEENGVWKYIFSHRPWCGWLCSETLNVRLISFPTHTHTKHGIINFEIYL